MKLCTKPREPSSYTIPTLQKGGKNTLLTALILLNISCLFLKVGENTLGFYLFGFWETSSLASNWFQLE